MKALAIVAFAAFGLLLVAEPWVRAVLLLCGVVNSYVWAHEVTTGGRE
jgi:hypothetical protein